MNRPKKVEKIVKVVLMTDLGSNIDHPMNPVKIALTSPAPSPLERGYAVGGGVGSQRVDKLPVNICRRLE
jgi:hypothetical protein